MSTATLSIDIVIINWNSPDDTQQLLLALRQELLELPGDWKLQLLVVDNGSTDESVSVIRAAAPGAVLIQLATNEGFTGGIAAASDASTADYLIFINNDAVPEKDFIRHSVNSLSSAPADVIATAGRIVSFDGQRIDFIGGVMTFDGHAFQRGFGERLGSASEPRAGAEMLFACGGNMIVRRRDFVELGGFDRDFFAYLEDVDFGWRTWLSGKRIIWNPSATVRHKSSATSARLGNFERGVLFERNAMQTMLKNLDDTSIRESTSQIFLTLLHRLHRYTLDRNQGTGRLSRVPVGEWQSGIPRDKFTRRVRRRIASLIYPEARGVVIDDELAIMQFRATEWLFVNQEKLLAKRAAVQRLRVVNDREIFEKFPLHYIPTYHGDEALMSSLLFRMLTPDVSVRTMSLAEIMKR